MQALALALLVAPCGAFFHGRAAGSGLVLRSRAARLGVQRPLCELPRVPTLLSAPRCAEPGGRSFFSSPFRRRLTLRMEGQLPDLIKFPCLHRLACKGKAIAPCPFALGGRHGGVAADSPPDMEGMELGELARILEEHGGALDHIHVSAAWVCLARIGGGGDRSEVVELLQDQTRSVLGQAGGHEIAPVMKSMARLHQTGVHVEARLLEAMQVRVY